MADLIITNADVVTMNDSLVSAQAIAVRGGRIVALGLEPEVLALRNSQTQVIDAAGCSLLPGMIDSHFHLYWGALRLAEMQLAEVRSLGQLQTVIQGYRELHPQEAILRGAGLGYDIVPGERLNRRHLDAILADVPLILTSFDFHNAWCNTAALQAAGILHGAKLPAHSEVVMDADGLASGELREFEAIQLVYQLVPELTAAQKRHYLREGVRLANSYGITSIHNMNGNFAEAQLYSELAAAQELSLRIYMPYSFAPDSPLAALEEALAMKQEYQTDFLKAGALKLFMDGVIESFTAYMLEPYINQPGSQGEALYSAAHFNEVVSQADKLGLQVIVHAIGDAAIRRTLDGFELAQHINAKRDSRHRIEHIELLHPADLPRFAELAVLASMQPYHCTRPEVDYLTPYLQCIAKDRYSDSFPWQALRSAGARLCFGSDWPVVSMNPFLGFDAAVNRQPWSADLSWQAQSLAQTLAGYTKDAAYAEFAETQKGQLKVGMLADMVLLSDNLRQLPSESLATLRAKLTVVAGKVCFRA